MRTHAHRDIKIVSYVLDGELERKDSMGNGEVLRPGEFQRITAGSGITHSEFSPSADKPTHFNQIRLLPFTSNRAMLSLEPEGEKQTLPCCGHLVLLAHQIGLND